MLEKGGGTLNQKQLLRDRIMSEYKGMFRQPGGYCKYPYIAPGSKQYNTQLWDWDSWWSDVAVRQIIEEEGNKKAGKEVFEHEKGCVLNFLEHCTWRGWMPIMIYGNGPIREEAPPMPENIYGDNQHKPVINQHVAFLIQQTGEAEWIREKYFYLQCLCNFYKSHQRHPMTGLYFWINDRSIGVDDDPCTWNRPEKSSASIYLNCLMYKELCACAFIGRKLGLEEVASFYQKDADELKEAINTYLWDERDGFYYSADLNLIDHKEGEALHAGYYRDYYCLIQRIDVWSGFLGLWAGIADEKQAERIVQGKYKNQETFQAAYGIRTLSRLEKMYNVRGSGNPSTWRGPVWGISNYLVFRGLAEYGYRKEAEELAEKTISLFAQDMQRTGMLHEYYEPDTGYPILNGGFQNWNYLVMNMMAWLEGKKVIKEF